MFFARSRSLSRTFTTCLEEPTDGCFSYLDLQRRRQYELESLQSELLAANVQVARMSELSERSRIAGKFTIRRGTKLSPPISLQIAWDLYKQTQVRAGLFSEALKRLDKGIARMRDTVHNLAPLQSVGVDGLRQLCETFQICPLEFKVYGNPARYRCIYGVSLNPVLKKL